MKNLVFINKVIIIVGVMDSGHVGQPEEANEHRILLGKLSRKSITCKPKEIRGKYKDVL
jgi:hypothetical protein